MKEKGHHEKDDGVSGVFLNKEKEEGILNYSHGHVCLLDYLLVCTFTRVFLLSKWDILWLDKLLLVDLISQLLGLAQSTTVLTSKDGFGRGL